MNYGARQRGPKCAMLSPFHVILSVAKDLSFSFRVNHAEHAGLVKIRATTEILRRRWLSSG